MKYYWQLFIQKRKLNTFLSFKETSSARYYKIVFIDSFDSLIVTIVSLPKGKHTQKGVLPLTIQHILYLHIKYTSES